MAKNLKINIKNTQLAEALKLGKIKKPPAASPSKTAAEPSHEKKDPEKKDKAPTKKVAAKASTQTSAEPPVPLSEVTETLPVTPPLPPPVNTPPPPVVAQSKIDKAETPTSSPPSSATPVISPSKSPTPQAAPHTTSQDTSTHAPTPQHPPRHHSTTGPSSRTAPPHGGYETRRPSFSQQEYRPRPAASPHYQRPAYPPRPRPPHGYSQSPSQAASPSGPRGTDITKRPLPPKVSDAPTKSFEEDRSAAKKAAGFKEYRDIKPQKKTDNRSFDSRDRQGLRVSDDENWKKRRPSQKFRPGIVEEIVSRPKNVSVRIPITVKDLAVEMKLKASQLISKLFMQGIVLTLNDYLDDETTIQLLGQEFDCEVAIDTSEEQRLRITDKTIQQEIQETDPAKLKMRPPVVAFMGHVDHGKTSLIDAIRKTKMAAGEAGAITQHIGAFKCHTAVGDLTILDTPGHEAFSAMRTRGAGVTDIVVLVVAGDEGMRAQTIEALNQAVDAKVTIVVAINKCDKPNFNAENVYRQLSEHNLLPEAWGGTTLTVNCSALTGTGIKELLEMLALQAEILELKANPQARARGSVIESEMHKGMGPVCTLLVQNGTLRVGDALVFDQHFARVKTMHDEHDKEMTIAIPSTPVKITGLSGLPAAGSEFIVVKDEKEARELSHGRTEGHKHSQLQTSKRASLESMMQKQSAKIEKKTLPLILRADVQGSLEALKNSLQKIVSEKVELNFISSGVGEISESDIQLASASKATIIGFHTKIESHAEELIKQTKVKVKTHDIIYHAVDDVKILMRDLLDKIPQETDRGAALVKATFKASQLGLIAGCQVTEGTIQRSNMIRVLRNHEVIWKGSMSSLKRVKEDVREVSKGMECGILLNNYNEVKEGDILQAYEITYLEQDI